MGFIMFFSNTKTNKELLKPALKVYFNIRSIIYLLTSTVFSNFTIYLLSQTNELDFAIVDLLFASKSFRYHFNQISNVENNGYSTIISQIIDLVYIKERFDS